MDQVGGAVHRVQDPDRAGRVDGGVVLFFGHELDRSVQRLQPGADLLLHFGIHRRDKVGGAFGAHLCRQAPVLQTRARLPYDAASLPQQRSGVHHRAAFLAASTAGDSPPRLSRTET